MWDVPYFSTNEHNKADDSWNISEQSAYKNVAVMLNSNLQDTIKSKLTKG